MGAIQVKVSGDVIDVNGIPELLRDDGHGAQVLFFGVVRNRNHGKNVLGVSYDAHPAMAEKVLREIADEAVEKWKDANVLIQHRTGRLGVGDCSVVIATSSPHRDEAYQASRYVIEELKERVPIWKKEHYEDGETEWLRGHALCQHGQAHE